MIKKTEASFHKSLEATHETNQELLQSMLQLLNRISYVKPEQIPDLDLYMDQVTGFMDEHLKKVKRHPDDKALTKTMINNYTKARILPPPVKKKYSKEHLFMLLFVYYYKGILSLDDLNTVLTPLHEKHFGQEKTPNIDLIYREVFALEASQMDVLKKDIKQKFALSEQTFSKDKQAFSKLPENERAELQMFAFICELAFDVYLKKLLMEKLCDTLKSEC